MNTPNFDGITSTNWKQLERIEVAPGIYERTVWQDNDDQKAVVVDFDAGACYPGIHSHIDGPEQIYVIAGVFNDGQRDHAAGSFIHHPVGSSHIPQSHQGCTVLVTFPGQSTSIQ